MRPSATPTVTMLPRAAESSPNFWRKSTARAGLSASFWLETSSSEPTWSAVSPSAARLRSSQARADVDLVAPGGRRRGRRRSRRSTRACRSCSSGRRRRGGTAAVRWAAVGSAEPRRSRSGRASGESPQVARTRSAESSRGATPVPVAGIWVRLRMTPAAARALQARAARGLKGMGVPLAVRCGCGHWDLGCTSNAGGYDRVTSVLVQNPPPGGSWNDPFSVRSGA